MTAVEPATLLADARAFVPELRERGREIDDLRQLPQDLAQRMADRGFYRLCAPASLGGTDTGPATMAEVCEILATGNGSAAWCVFIGSTSQYTLVNLGEEQLSEILATPNVLTSGVFASTGQARPATQDGEPGWLVDGTWAWGSGCHNASWISGGVMVQPDDGDPYDARAYFRPDELDIDDDWHTSGMRGSGSSTFHARRVWLPHRRITDPKRRSPHADHPIYRFPQFAILCVSIGSICLGMARASIDEAVAVARDKTPMGSNRSLSQRPHLHGELARADTTLRAARALLYGEIGSAWDTAATDRPDLDARRRLRTAVVHAVTTSVEVIDAMYTAVGGSSVYEDSPLQRHLRDVHVATQHMMVGAPVMELAGRVLVGIDDRAPGL